MCGGEITPTLVSIPTAFIYEIAEIIRVLCYGFLVSIKTNKLVSEIGIKF